MFMETKEMIFKGFRLNGFAMLFVHLIIVSAAIVGCFVQVSEAGYAIGVLLFLVWCVLFAGYMQLEPNEARAMVFSVNIKVRLKKPDFSGSIRFLPRKNSRSVHVISMWNPLRSMIR